MTEEFHFFWKSPLGQWNKSPFVDENKTTYLCAEQYMMYQKALLFNDLDAAKLILNEKSPKKQQELGRTVKNFDKDIWDEHAKTIVFKGNLLKFTQNEPQRNLLLSTIGKTLVEASPFDLIWGIGLGEDDPDRFDRTKWRGTNWLGECLMKVRELLDCFDIIK